jgi:C_GCAxxG_C_C family probable redox protein
MKEISEASQTAGRYYNDGQHHCCEAIIQAVSEELGLDKDTLLRIATPFGGGLAGNGSVCGSLIAAYILLGATRGRESLDEDRSAAAEPASRIYQKFCQRFGSANCREIVGYDKKDPQAVAEFGEKVKREICTPMTQEVTGWILEELQ